MNRSDRLPRVRSPDTQAVLRDLLQVGRRLDQVWIRCPGGDTIVRVYHRGAE